jgi:hypothetical protein
MTFALETGRHPDERNPVFSGESFNDRWPKDAMEMRVPREDLRHLVRELERARQSELTEIRKMFDDLFGETVSGRAVQGYMDGVTGRPGPTPYERGKGFVAAPAIWLRRRWLRPDLSGAVSPLPLRSAAMKRIRRIKPRSWGAQVDRMRIRWPEMRHVEVAAKDTVAWIGPLRGFQMSYGVQVQWNWATDRAFPHVFILEPALRPRDGERFIDIPHLLFNRDRPEQSALETEKLDAIADRGYFNGAELLAVMKIESPRPWHTAARPARL